MSNINGSLMLITDIFSRPNMYKTQTKLLPEGWNITSDNDNRLEATEYTITWQNKVLAEGKKDEEKKNYKADVYKTTLLEYIESKVGIIEPTLTH